MKNPRQPLELAHLYSGPKWAWPFATSEIPAVPARFKARPEDFAVEELSSLEHAGHGDHVHLWIEKRGIATSEAVRRLARALGVSASAAGTAGLKDADAVSRQWVSLEHVDPAALESRTIEGLRVLETRRHTHKLKRGALTCNRFRVRLREVEPHREADLRAVLDVLRRRGLPNYFGLQRFGARGDNAAMGALILRGGHEEAVSRMLGRPSPLDSPRVRQARELFDAGELEAAARAWPRVLAEPARVAHALARGSSPARALRSLPRSWARFHVSALQSWIFNDVLAERLDGYDRVLAGDLAFDHESMRVFPLAGSAQDHQRAAKGEVSATGPLVGRELRTPAGPESEALERRVLERHDEAVRALAGGGRSSWPGARRPLRVPLKDIDAVSGADDHGTYVELRFDLPPGGYASLVVAEIAKDELARGPEAIRALRVG